MSTNFAKEFKLYESLFSGRTVFRRTLKEALSLSYEDLFSPRVEKDGSVICDMCHKRFSQADGEVFNGVFGKNVCYGDCNDDYLESAGNLESFIEVALDSANLGYLESVDMQDIVKNWREARSSGQLKFSTKQLDEIEQAFFENVKNAGITLETTADIKGVKIITIWDGNESDKQVLEFASFEEAAKHFDHVYVNAVEEEYAEEVLYPVLDAMNNEEYDYIDDDGYAVYEQRVSTSVFESYPAKNSALAEARKRNNPTPPTTLKIVKIEPWLQARDGYQRGQYRHCDNIYYIDPIYNTEMRAMVWEEDPGYGKYFGWGGNHSNDGWSYAAYDYDGKLLPGVDPTSHLSAAIKANISKTVKEINKE